MDNPLDVRDSSLKAKEQNSEKMTAKKRFYHTRSMIFFPL
jgi:hypothetical protein